MIAFVSHCTLDGPQAASALCKTHKPRPYNIIYNAKLCEILITTMNPSQTTYNAANPITVLI